MDSVGDGIQIALTRTAEGDSHLRKLLGQFSSDFSGMAVLASGGYGRGDITLLSDLDLIIIFKEEKNRFTDKIRAFIQGLWDHGWNPGQTILQLNEVNSDFLAIPDRASALLEARFVWGDRKLIDQLETRLIKQFSNRVWQKFILLKQEEFEARRKKFGNVAKIIEPHLKQQAGGMRDIQHVLWLERARSALNGSWRIKRKRNSEIKAFLGRLKRAGLLTKGESANLLHSYDMLLRIRESLRNKRKRPEDKLDVHDQVSIGRELGYKGNDRNVMRDLMKEAFFAMERIARFADEFGPLLIEYDIRNKPKKLAVVGMNGVSSAGGRLYLNKRALNWASSDPENLLKLIGYSISNNLLLSGRARHSLRRHIHTNKESSLLPKNWAKPLNDLFHTTDRLARWMRCMDELDVINLWLPEWYEIVSLTTGSFYHTFAVDEHTLRALERLEDLPSDGPEGLPLSLWKNVDNKAVVFLSIIFHDIAKGRRGDHSLEGAKIAQVALKRVGLGEYADDVSKLVRLHLRMEQVGFRRDSKDPAVITGFAKKVGGDRILKALYLLTVCDLSAVSAGVWTAWKSRLLAELYIETKRWYSHGVRFEDVSVESKAEKVASIVGKEKTTLDKVTEFLGTMREEYFRVVPPDEIAKHVNAADVLSGGKVDSIWQIDKHSGYILLTLITWDWVGLLAQIAGFLLTQGIGIREARIFTRKDGVVIDRFRAEDLEPNGVPLNERISAIPKLWNKIETSEIELAELFEKFKRRRRFIKPDVAKYDSEVSITPTSNGVLVDVAGPDSPGLLFRLCSVLAENGLDVQAARVSGRLDGIMDAFLVKDENRNLESDTGQLNLINRLREVVYETP